MLLTAFYGRAPSWVGHVISFLCPVVTEKCQSALSAENSNYLTSDGHLILFQSYTTVTESFRRFLKSPQALLLPTDEPNSHIPDKVK